MDIAFKVLASFLAVSVIFVSGLAFSIANSSEQAVNNYFESVSKAVIDSDYSETVINELVEDAAESGHELDVKVYVLDQGGAKKCADIRLKYNYEVKLFNVSIERTKQKIL